MSHKPNYRTYVSCVVRLRRVSRVALFEVGRQCCLVMPAFFETQPADPAELADAAEPGTASAPSRSADNGGRPGGRRSGRRSHPGDPQTLRRRLGALRRLVPCSRAGSALPAKSETLAAYLIQSAPGLSGGALGRRRSAISTMHRQASLANARCWTRSPTRPCGPRRSRRTRKVGSLKPNVGRARADWQPNARAIFPACATARCCSWPRPRCGRVGEASGRLGPWTRAAKQPIPTGVARQFVLALDAEHVRFTPTGVDLQLRTRTDEAVPSRTVTLTRAMTAASCPVRALEEWLRSSDTAFGPVFRKVDRWGNVEHGRLGPDAWHRILVRRTETPRRTSAKRAR